jgi:hypothetical protein
MDLTISSDMDDYEEDFVCESESEYEDAFGTSGSLAPLPPIEAAAQRKSTGRNFLDEAMRNESADIPIDDALTFLADLIGQANRIGSATGRSSGRVLVRSSARSRNSREHVATVSLVASGRRSVRIETE